MMHAVELYNSARTTGAIEREGMIRRKGLPFRRCRSVVVQFAFFQTEHYLQVFVVEKTWTKM